MKRKRTLANIKKRDVADFPALVTLQFAAQVLLVHPATMRRWVHDKTVPASRVGHKWLIKREDLLALLNGQSRPHFESDRPAA